MGLIINNNVAALNAHKNLSVNDARLSRSLERLSSGLRINRAADDAAGLTISEKMRGQVGGLRAAMRNGQDGISLVQTAEGALNEIHSILQRMRELAVQSSNDTLIDDDRVNIAAEVTQLTEEIERMVLTTTFNEQELLNGNFANGDKFIHIGANENQTIIVTINEVSTAVLGVDAGNVNVGDQPGSELAITTIDNAIESVSIARADLGAVQNRIDHAITNLSVSIENISAAESRIRDLDVAAEMVNFTRNQIMLQAGTAMLAQANAAPQSVLSLLRG